VLALALGTCLTAVVAWQLGELLGAGPTDTQLSDVGARLTSSLTLGSFAALAVAPFTALLAYVMAVLYAPGDDLGRIEPDAATAWPGPEGVAEPVPGERPLADVPPAGRPAG
jgi:hypothetical protein